MPKRATPLSAQKVQEALPGRYFDGDGLVLLVREANAAWWLFRYTRDGRTRDAGLGRARGPNSVSLAEARKAAARLRTQVAAGADPLAEREVAAAQKKAQQTAAAAVGITFRSCAEQYIHIHRPSWKNDKHAAQWQATLEAYAFPVIGHLPVGAIETGHLTQILQPLWMSKVETGSRLRGRIESVLDFAKVYGWRIGENPARWRGHLQNVLPRRSKAAVVTHHAALPWKDIGGFMECLGSVQGVPSLALAFAILTAARTNEVIGARWVEFNLPAKVWTIPAARMKAAREHRVPLSEAAVAILGKMDDGLLQSDDAFVFRGRREGKPLSSMAMLMLLRRLKWERVTVHGFRSTFRDWAAETGRPDNIAEAALAHIVGDKTVAAYQRADLLERRRRLMDDWSTFCGQPSPAEGEKTCR